MIVLAIGWSAVFRIPITVGGRGILLAPGGVVDVASDASGQVQAITVHPGDIVRAGQIVARIEQPEVRLKLSLAQGEFIDAQNLRDTIGGLQGRDTAAQSGFREARSGALAQKIAALGAQRIVLAERVAAMERMAAKGLITRERLLDANLSLVSLDGQIADARNEGAQMSTQAETNRSGQQREMMDALRRLADARRNVSALREQLARTGAIRSAFAGRVVEIKASVGQVVSGGTPILTIERGTATAGDAVPVAIVFVSAADGKKLHVGMPAAISG